MPSEEFFTECNCFDDKNLINIEFKFYNTKLPTYQDINIEVVKWLVGNYSSKDQLEIFRIYQKKYGYSGHVWYDSLRYHDVFDLIACLEQSTGF